MINCLKPTQKPSKSTHDIQSYEKKFEAALLQNGSKLHDLDAGVALAHLEKMQMLPLEAQNYLIDNWQHQMRIFH